MPFGPVSDVLYQAGPNSKAQRPMCGCPKIQQEFGLGALLSFILLLKREKAIQVRGRDGCEK